MKLKSLVAVTTLLLCTVLPCLLMATVTISVPGYFGGDLSYHTASDTIMFVLLETQASEDVPNLHAKFYISTNAGVNWAEHSLPYAPSKRTRPTLTVLEDRILVSMENYVFESTDLGENWIQSELYIPIREAAPYLFERNSELSRYQLNLPFRQFNQSYFAMDDTDTSIIRPYSYYADSYLSPNELPAPWLGQNIMSGIVGGGSDMYIRQTGSGNNGGWPTFAAPVSMGGEIVSNPSNYPINQVFQGGLWENQDNGDLPVPDNLRKYALMIGQGEGHIYLIEVNGGNYSTWHGILSEPIAVSVPVYDQYPPNENSQIIFTNEFTVRDTIWVPAGGGMCSNGSFFVNGELWIKGNFSGKQTWGASGNIRIIGDILLQNTSPGASSEDNDSDLVNLVSEKKILYAYGYKNPADSVRIHPFVGSADDPHYIYANLYALGLGPREGVVEFEYQHPHPSTPAVYYDGIDGVQLFDNIDLHRHKYPPTDTMPWPAELDLPWYNPLWPEQNPYLERGVIKVFGNIYQRKRGYVHRSLHDTEYPSNSGVWDIANDLCGGPSDTFPHPDPVLGNDLILQCQNYPGAAGAGVGYMLEYHNDLRTEMIVAETGFYTYLWEHGIRILNEDSCPIFFEPINRAIISKTMTQRDGVYVYAANDHLLYDDGQDIISLSELTRGEGIILSVQLDPQNNILLITDKQDQGQQQIIKIDPNQATIIDQIPFDNMPWNRFVGMHVTDGGRILLARIIPEDSLVLHEITDAGAFNLINQWWFPEISHASGSRIYLKSADEFSVDIFLQEDYEQMGFDNWANVMHIRSDLPVSNPSDIVPALDIAVLNAYPNPARNALNIELKMPAHTTHSLEIYNIRGQKVKSLGNAIVKGENTYELSWNLQDESNRPLASGVYIMRLKIDGKTALSKKITVH